MRTDPIAVALVSAMEARAFVSAAVADAWKLGDASVLERARESLRQVDAAVDLLDDLDRERTHGWQ